MPEILFQRPSGEPVHVEEAKLHLRVTDISQDSRIASLISVARQNAEMKTRQQMLHARWKLTLDRFPMAGMGTPLPFAHAVNIPSFAVMLPHAPLVDVVSIEYVAMDGTTQTMPATDYAINKAMTPALITPAFGKIWPITLPQIAAVTITYDAGYASPIKVAHSASATNITVTGPVTWAVGDSVRFYNSGGTLPAPLDPDADYTIATAVSGVYTINDAAGAAVNFTTDGSGRNFIGVVPEGLRNWMLLRVASMYENREEIVILSRGKIEQLPFADGLLDEFRTSMP